MEDKDYNNLIDNIKHNREQTKVNNILNNNKTDISNLSKTGRAILIKEILNIKDDDQFLDILYNICLHNQNNPNMKELNLNNNINNRLKELNTL
jgi:hypothetical protein